MDEAVQLSRFFEAGFALFCALTPAGTFKRVNSLWKDLLGYEPEELVEKNISEFTYKNDVAATRKAISAARGNQASDFVNRFRCRDGGYRQLEWQVIRFGELIYASAQDVAPFAERNLSRMQSEIDRYSKMFKNIPAIMAVSSAVTGRITDMNDAFTEMLGYSRDETIGRTADELNIYEDAACRKKTIDLLLQQGSFKDEIIRLRSKQGNTVVGLCSGVMLKNQDEDLFFTVTLDMTDRMEAERLLRERACRFESMLDSLPEAVFYKDLEGVYSGCNPRFAKTFDIKREEVVGKTDFELVDPETARHIWEDDKKVIHDRQTVRFEGWMTIGGGKKTLHETMKAPCLDLNGNVTGIVGISRDITENKLWEKEIQYFSFHDQMTGLYNRRFYEEELRRIDVERNLPITIIMADVDSLKFINDAFGHDEGDVLIKRTAQAIKSSCRSEDIIARVGGDEFAIVLPHTDSGTSQKVLGRIQALLSQEKVGVIAISVSFGAATKMKRDENIYNTIKQAEKNMYSSKLAHRTEIKVNSINNIISTLFEKCQQEMEHSRRVGILCKAISTHMGLNEETVKKVRLAGIMHDIGKIDIADSILNKRERLSEYERVAVNNHPELGYRILSTSKEFSDIAVYVFQHHENWNGSGYPKGLKGEEILLPARIISVAGAYDAMANPSYKKPLGRKEIVKELRRCAGKEFDPVVVKVFIEQVLNDPELDL